MPSLQGLCLVYEDYRGLERGLVFNDWTGSLKGQVPGICAFRSDEFTTEISTKNIGADPRN
jgi:hypothetical protein